MAKYSPPAKTHRQAKIAIALFTASSCSHLFEQMVIGRYGSSPRPAEGKLNPRPAEGKLNLGNFVPRALGMAREIKA
jgi:hypothetical protein